MNTHCMNCGKLIVNKRGGAKFCCLECKNEYGYRHRQGRLNGLDNLKLVSEKHAPDVTTSPLEDSLKNLVEREQETQQPKPFKQPPSVDAEFFKELVEESQLPPLNNVVTSMGDIIEVDAEEVGDEEIEGWQTPEEFERKMNEIESEAPEITLPEKYVDRIVTVDNPVFKSSQNTLDQNRLRKQQIEQEIEKLEGALRFQESSNGNGLMIVGGIGAALYGFLQNPSGDQPGTNSDRRVKYFLKSSKKKISPTKKPKEPTFLQRLFKGLLYGTVGTGAGYVAKTATDIYRKEIILKIKRAVEDLKKEMKNLQSSISRDIFLLAMSPKQITQTQKMLNPDYTNALNGIIADSNKNKTQNENMKQPPKNKSSEPVFKSKKVIRSTELSKQNFKALDFRGLWKEFFGLPSINFHALIHGNSGEGKSTFCLWFARYLAKNFGRVLYVSGEEGFGKTFHDKLISCKANVPNLFLLDVRTGDDFMNETGTNEFHFIILDSLHDMEIDARKLKVIFEKYKDSAFICIDQNNKKGELLGANEKKHIVDIVVNIKNYVAETTKNRFKAKGVVTETKDFIDTAG